MDFKRTKIRLFFSNRYKYNHNGAVKLAVELVQYDHIRAMSQGSEFGSVISVLIVI